MTEFGLGQFISLQILLLFAVVALTVLATTLVTRDMRQIVKSQGEQIAHLTTTQHNLQNNINRLQDTVDIFTGYMEALGIPIPQSREEAREILRTRDREQAQARWLSVPIDTLNLRHRSAELRNKPHGNQPDARE